MKTFPATPGLPIPVNPWGGYKIEDPGPRPTFCEDITEQTDEYSVDGPPEILRGPDTEYQRLVDHQRAAMDEAASAPMNRPKTNQSVVRIGKLVVNLDQRVVLVDDHPVHLTAKEYGIVELLVLHMGTPLTKAMIVDHLYGGLDEPEVKIIDVFVCNLRKKLAQATGGSHYIETVWDRGYVLRDPIITAG
jgi:DNA-binding winged helix-turn-helix (wHTH) protein